MKNQYIALIALLAGAEHALASTHNTVYCQNAVNCDPKQSGPKVSPTLSPTVNLPPVKRDVEWLNEVVKRDVEAMDTLTALFRRDPEYEQAMSILARNAAAADASTQKIVQQIHAGTVPPEIVKAAKAKGLITGNGPAGKSATGGGKGGKGGSKKAARDLEARATKGGKGGSSGGKGGKGGKSSGGGDAPQTPSQIAQHIMSGGHIPPEITQALKDSPHYEHGGSSKGGSSGGKGAKGGASKGGKSTSKKASKARRDAGSFFDFDVADIFSRGEKKISFSDVKALVEKAEKDSKAKDEILKDINGDKKVQKGFKKLAGSDGDDDDEDFTLDDLSSLVADADKKQKKAIEKFFSKDKVSGVTSSLIKKYGKKGKRDAEPEADFEDSLYARDPEAEAEAEFEDELFAREAEPEYEVEDIFVRDAEAEGFYDFE